MSQPWFAVSAPPTAAPMPDERHLPEAHLAGPPGEHHEREPDDPEDHDHRGEVDLRLGEPERQREQRGRGSSAPSPQRAYRTSGMLHELARDRPHLARGLPGRDVAAARAGSAAW